MEANGLPLRFLFGEDVLEIPFFQRTYVWHPDDWRELLEDLLRTSGSHFLGSIILKRPKKIAGEANKAIVIDGQQRLTTLSIIIKALYDCISNKKSSLISNARDVLFYTLKASDSHYHHKIRHSHNDRIPYEEVIGTVSVDEDHKDTFSNLK